MPPGWTAWPVCGWAARRFQHKLDEATAGGKRLFTPLNFLAVAAVVGVATVVATVYTPSYVVSVDGVPLGTVSDPPGL